MRKLLFRSRSGEGYPMVIAVTLCLLMLFMLISEYFRVNIIVQGVRDAVQQAVIATVNENYDDVYHSVREGYAAGWFPEGDGEWFESIDAGDIYGNLSYILGLTTDGEGYMKYAGNELEYTLSDLSVHISNNAIASGRSEGYLATATLHLEVPTRFAGRVLPPVSVNLRVEAKYIPKFLCFYFLAVDFHTELWYVQDKMIVHQPLQRKEFDYDRENKTHHPHCGRRPVLRGAGSGDRQPPCCGTHAH